MTLLQVIQSDYKRYVLYNLERAKRVEDRNDSYTLCNVDLVIEVSVPRGRLFLVTRIYSLDTLTV